MNNNTIVIIIIVFIFSPRTHTLSISIHYINNIIITAEKCKQMIDTSVLQREDCLKSEVLYRIKIFI